MAASKGGSIEGGRTLESADAVVSPLREPSSPDNIEPLRERESTVETLWVVGWTQPDLQQLAAIDFEEPVMKGLLKKLLPTLLLALFVACPSTAIQGTNVWGQAQYTLNTEQKCIHSTRTVLLADRAVAAYALAAVERGLAPDIKTVTARFTSPARPGVCLIQKPEACRIGSACAMGSTGRDCSPRAGCAGESWLWVSVEWPAGVVRDWCLDLLHEVGHVMAARLWVADSPDHATAWHDTEMLASKYYSCAP